MLFIEDSIEFIPLPLSKTLTMDSNARQWPNVILGSEENIVHFLQTEQTFEKTIDEHMFWWYIVNTTDYDWL